MVGVVQEANKRMQFVRAVEEARAVCGSGRRPDSRKDERWEAFLRLKGNRRILFVDKARKRRVRLGKLPMSRPSHRTKVEALNAAATVGNSPDREVAEWLRTRDRKLYDKLAAVGLAPERAARDISTLGLFLDRYLSTRNDVKPSTARTLQRGPVGTLSTISAPASCW